MKEPKKCWTIIFVISIHVLSTSAWQNIQDLPLTFECDNEYQCSTDPASTFALGKQYVYSYQLASTMKVDRVAYKVVHDEDESGNSIITENGTLIVAPITTCEFTAILKPSVDITNEQVSLKIAFDNETIKRVCVSKQHSDHNRVNTLKSLMTMMLPIGTTALNDGVSNDEVMVQNSSRGSCLTKYTNCTANNHVQVKYQSINYCETNHETLLQSIHLKVKDFAKSVSKFSESANEICEVSNHPLETLNIPKGITICSLERTNGIVNSSTCVESLEIEKLIPMSLVSGEFYNSIALKLIEERTNSEINNEAKTFIKTSIHQAHKRKQGESTQDEELSPGNYQNAWEELAHLDKIEQINTIRSLIKTSSGVETLIQFLNNVDETPSTSSSKLILMALATEAANKNAMEFIQTAFTSDLLMSQLSNSEKEDILHKIFFTSLHAEPTKELLQFSEFLLEYVFENRRDFSDKTKLNAAIAYSSILNEFCTQMELITGEMYCKQMSVIQQSPVAKMLTQASNSFENIMLLEAQSNYQHHDPNVSACATLNKSNRDGPIGLWSVLNCYRSRPCDKLGKQFYIDLLEDESVSSNIKITAFLSMRRCFVKEDLDVIRKLLDTRDRNDELVTFIKGYKANRDLYAFVDPLSLLPEESGVVADDIEMGDNNKSSKLTVGSNSLAVFKLPYVNVQLQLETNMLYFDKPSILPELITVSVSGNSINQFAPILQVEIYVEDLSNQEQSQFPLDFKITTFIRRLGHTVCMKEIILSHEKLMHLIYSLQMAVNNAFSANEASTFAQEKLRQVIMDAVNIDTFDFGSLFQGNAFISTISGVPYDISWNVNSFTSLLISKNNCSDLFSQDNIESSCHLAVQPELNINAQLSLSLGSDHNARKGGILHGNLIAAFPTQLLLSRDQDAITETVKVTLPSVYTPILKLQADFKEFDRNRTTNSFQLSLGLGVNGLVFNTHNANVTGENNRPLEITVAQDRKSNIFTARVIDTMYEFNMESKTTEDYAYSMKANLTCMQHLEQTKSYALEVGYRNAKDSKKILGKFISNGDEYSLYAYYNRVLKNWDINRNYGFLSCRNREGTGILCWWPFCAFCGTEYFIGATVHTPQFKNVKLFEIEVTQVFPKKKINLLLKSEGIPVIGRTEFKASLSHGNDTILINNVRMRDTINEKLNIASSTNKLNGGGDALPEAESRVTTYSTTLYSLDAQFFSEILGQTDSSLVYLSYLPYPGFTYESRLFCGEILYPTKNKGEQERLSYLSTFIYSSKSQTNLPISVTWTNSLRSSQLPVLNLDLNSRYQKLESNVAKTVIVVRPVNLIRGEIKVEVTDYAERDYNLGFLSSLENIHLNQTYKVYLPDPSTLKILKGKVMLKRENYVLHTAGVEVFVGVDEALELKYDFHAEQNNSFEILTSVTTAGETYGLYHHVEPVGESAKHLHDGTGVAENNDESCGQSYSGTYVLGEQSWKATGTFKCRTGRELLPFSTFDINVNSVEGKEMGMRIFGAETVQREKIHNITVSALVGNSSVFEFLQEINPFEEIPIKANIFLKDYGELKITDRSKLANKRNLHAKAKWFPNKKLVQGKIAFPTSLTVSPLYLDFDAVVENEAAQGSPSIQLNSKSTLSIWKNLSVSTNNIIQLKDLKWSTELEGYFIDESSTSYDDNSVWQSKNLKTFAFSVHHILPNFDQYALEILNYYYSDNSLKNHHQHNLKIYRPNVTPFQLSVEVQDRDRFDVGEQKIGQRSRAQWGENRTMTVNFIATHKDNFLYIFPFLSFDFNVTGQREVNRIEELSPSGHWSLNAAGKLTCRSNGANDLPFCNLLNMSFAIDSKYKEDYASPWVAKVEVVNDLKNFIDQIDMKMIATYQPVKETTVDISDMEDDIVFSILNTIYGGNVLRKIYGFEYQFDRKCKNGNAKNNENHLVGVRGTYMLTKMYESFNFFELSDEHNWKSFNSGDFHIWTNILNHTTDSSSELATFSSQYVSLNEDGNGAASKEGSANITWMELRSFLNINGIGPLSSLIKEPSLLLNTYDGNIEADFLVKTEFSPVKAFRVTVSHEHSKSENEEDDSSKFDTLTKLNAIFNDKELSGDNSLTLSLGKVMAVGNSLNGRFGSTENSYEYIAIKAFGLSSQYPESDKDNLIHFDVSSSLTNADDDDIDLRVVNDVIWTPSYGLPLFRFKFIQNSTDLDMERNISILVYQSEAKENLHQSGVVSSTLPLNVISESLDELSFAQPSLQSVTQQILDDYAQETDPATNATDIDNYNQPWHDYNFEFKYRFNVQGNSSDVLSNLRWFGFEEKVFHCQSGIAKCYDYGENSTTIKYKIDSSNYCNLIILPFKPALALL